MSDDGTKCKWFNLTDECNLTSCDQPATHYACDYAGTVNVCQAHKCRCKPPVPLAVNTRQDYVRNLEAENASLRAVADAARALLGMVEEYSNVALGEDESNLRAALAALGSEDT